MDTKPTDFLDPSVRFEIVDLQMRKLQSVDTYNGATHRKEALYVLRSALVSGDILPIDMRRAMPLVRANLEFRDSEVRREAELLANLYGFMTARRETPYLPRPPHFRRVVTEGPARAPDRVRVVARA